MADRFDAIGREASNISEKHTPLLEVKHISKSYRVGGKKPFTSRRIVALEDVSLTLERGQTVGLIGESGCGKSTLGRIIARLMPPDSGDILWEGNSLWPEGAFFDRHSIQMVFQDLGSALNPGRRIRWIIQEALRAKKIHRDGWDQVIKAMLPRVGLDWDYLERYPHELSGGQKQRVAILLAILMEPGLIVADEVVSSLDVSVRAQILNLMQELQQAMGLSYLFISHDVGTVYYMSHKVAVMYLGQIVEEGSADAVYLRGWHPYTRLLLSSRLEGGETRPAAVEQAGEIPSRLRLGPGCRFADRCPLARQSCRKEKPPLREVEEGHWVRCPYCE